MKSPYVYAAAASGYILAIAMLMSNLSRLFPGPDTVLAPISMLSLLTLSVALMGFLFFYEPAALFLDGKRTEALGFFARTLSTFAVLTAVVFVVALLLR